MSEDYQVNDNLKAIEVAPGLVWVLAEEPDQPRPASLPLPRPAPKRKESKPLSQGECVLLMLAYTVAAVTLGLILGAVEFLDDGGMILYTVICLLINIWLLRIAPEPEGYEPERPPCSPSRINYTGRD